MDATGHGPLGDHLGELELDFGEVLDFGLPLLEILSGVDIPLRGVRLDVPVSGVMSGDALGGRVTGTDHLDVRPGLQIVRHLHLAFFTSNGGRVSAMGEATVTPTPTVPVTDVRVALLCRSATASTAWIDGQTLWAVGSVDPLAGRVVGDVYLAATQGPNRRRVTLSPMPARA